MYKLTHRNQWTLDSSQLSITWGKQSQHGWTELLSNTLTLSCPPLPLALRADWKQMAKTLVNGGLPPLLWVTSLSFLNKWQCTREGDDECCNTLTPILHDLGCCQLLTYWSGGRQWLQPLRSGLVLGFNSPGSGLSGSAAMMVGKTDSFSGWFCYLPCTPTFCSTTTC